MCLTDVLLCNKLLQMKWLKIALKFVNRLKICCFDILGSSSAGLTRVTQAALLSWWVGQDWAQLAALG